MSHNFLAPWSSCPGTEVGLCPAKAGEWSERLVGTKNIGDFSILSTFSSRFGTYFLLFQQRSTELINGLAYVGGWTWSTNGSVVGVGGSCGKKKASDKQAWVIYVISYQSRIPKWRTQTTCPSLLERGCQQVWGTTSLHCLDEVIFCPSSLNRPQTIPHLHLTNQQGSTVWQVDTWGMVLFWNNSNLQICKAMSLYIPPNWCRNRSSIEDCSLIWCDSIVRSSKKATPQTTSVAYLARAPECRKAFGSFHGHLMGMKNIRNRQPILHTGWSIWMALTYTFHWAHHVQPTN
jgi:hypothetical protein